MKRKSLEILQKIQSGEEVATTTVHLSEVANVIESRAGVRKAAEFVKEFMLLGNVEILSVDAEDYLKAALIALERDVDVNDALAYSTSTSAGWTW